MLLFFWITERKKKMTINHLQNLQKQFGLLRSFFLIKGFEEVHTQNRLVYWRLVNPFNVATYNYGPWPYFPQKMWLEHELLSKPDAKGFCVSTSYRQEPEMLFRRHDIYSQCLNLNFQDMMI